MRRGRSPFSAGEASDVDRRSTENGECTLQTRTNSDRGGSTPLSRMPPGSYHFGPERPKQMDSGPFPSGERVASVFSRAKLVGKRCAAFQTRADDQSPDPKRSGAMKSLLLSHREGQGASAIAEELQPARLQPRLRSTEAPHEVPAARRPLPPPRSSVRNALASTA